MKKVIYIVSIVIAAGLAMAVFFLFSEPTKVKIGDHSPPITSEIKALLAPVVDVKKTPVPERDQEIEELKALLKDPSRANEWRDYILKITYYGGSQEMSTLLEYISSIPEVTRINRMDDPNFVNIERLYTTKIQAIALFGLMNTQESEKILLDAYNNPESLELISAWLNEARNDGYEEDKEFFISFYKSRAAFGLIYTQKPELVDIVVNDYANFNRMFEKLSASGDTKIKEYEDENYYESMYYGWLVDALAQNEVIKLKGKEYLFFSKEEQKDELLNESIFKLSFFLKDVKGYSISQ